MAKIKDLQDIIDLDIKSLEEMYIDESASQHAWRYKKYFDFEDRLVKEGKAPSLPAYLIYEHWFNGKSSRDLGDELGVSYQTCINVMRKLGIPVRRYKIFKTNHVTEKLKRMYWQENKTQQEIASRFGCHYTTIGRLLRKCRIPLQNHSQISGSEIRDAYIKEEMTLNDIAEKYSVSPSTVSRTVKRFGLPLRQPKRAKEDAYN